jgi:hypothetical protein
VTNVKKHARRILAGIYQTPRDVAGFRGYLSFEHQQYPTWWDHESTKVEWGAVLGVHENVPNTQLGSVLICENGLGVVLNTGVCWAHYLDVAGYERLHKEPVSMRLILNLKSGAKLELPFDRYVGAAFTFVQFLSRAQWEHNRFQTLATVE